MSVFEAKAKGSASEIYLANELIKVESAQVIESGKERLLAIKLKGLTTSLSIESPLTRNLPAKQYPRWYYVWNYW
ncbi:MAG: hypothetical protein R2850_03055 [Bacteroidia bacterium]